MCSLTKKGNFVTKVKTDRGITEIKHGAAIIAIGADVYQPTEYLYGKDDRVLTQLETKAIIGGKSRIHIIDQEKCIKCGTCFEVCPPKFGAVTKISGMPVPSPSPEKERTIVENERQQHTTAG